MFLTNIIMLYVQLIDLKCMCVYRCTKAEYERKINGAHNNPDLPYERFALLLLYTCVSKLIYFNI